MLSKTKIILGFKEQSDLGPHCLSKGIEFMCMKKDQKTFIANIALRVKFEDNTHYAQIWLNFDVSSIQ